MLYLDGSRRIYGQPDGSSGTSRRIFLTQMIDPHGNTVQLTYDANLRVVAITDAIGQVTTVGYQHPQGLFIWWWFW
jgi:YD repeat-containing protein